MSCIATCVSRSCDLWEHKVLKLREARIAALSALLVVAASIQDRSAAIQVTL
jgi:hypothetical protein